jgi:hypothetical protein
VDVFNGKWVFVLSPDSRPKLTTKNPPIKSAPGTLGRFQVLPGHVKTSSMELFEW